jgi:hypothetical protein
MAKTRIGRASEFEIVEENESASEKKSVMDEAETYKYIPLEEIAAKVEAAKDPAAEKRRRIIGTLTNFTLIASMVAIFWWPPAGLIMIASLLIKIYNRPKDQRKDWFMWGQ